MIGLKHHERNKVDVSLKRESIVDVTGRTSARRQANRKDALGLRR
jgi:hypothetical protein